MGREAVMRQWEQLRDAWDADAVELVSDFIDAGDRVVVRLIGEAKAGPRVELELTSCLHGAQGQGLHQEFFWDHAEALEAVGLSEQDAHAD